jgi:hypothetical protein
MENVAIKKFLSSGDGYGYGDGSGYGYGYGNGDGDGNASGAGSGNASGDGAGYGSGYGYGDGYKINNDFIHKIDEIPTIIKNIKGSVASGFIIYKDLTQSKTYVVKGNGYFAHGETIKLAMQALEEKIMQDLEPDELIEKFLEVTDINKSYPATYFFEWHGKLTGSCLQGRESFVKNNNIDLTKDMDIHKFIEICKDSYGKDVFKMLIEKLK